MINLILNYIFVLKYFTIMKSSVSHGITILSLHSRNWAKACGEGPSPDPISSAKKNYTLSVLHID